MINYKVDKELLIITLPESITSVNGDDIEQEINGLCQQVSHDQLILEADQTVFISSRGLRIFLNLKRAGERIRIVKTSAEVYNVLEITGLTQIIKIDKAFRRVDLDKAQFLSHGAAGAVYRINNDEIIKVPYKQSTPEELIQEIWAAKQALINGVPTVISYDVVECGNGQLGTVYEAINSQTFSSYIMDHPDELDVCVEKYVSLLKCIHTNHQAQGKLPSLQTLFRTYLEEQRGTVLSPMATDRMLQVIPLLPDADTLVHGDCHPKNVMIGNGELLFIDIGDIAIGHPMIDLIGFYMVEVHSHTIFAPDQIEAITGFSSEVRSRFTTAVLQRYFGYDDERLTWIMQLMSELVIFFMASFALRRLPSGKARDIFISQVEEMATRIDSSYLTQLKQRIDSWAEDF